MNSYERYENPNKVYISVTVLYYDSGGFIPIAIIWEDDREYWINKVIDIRRAASLKAGGTGIRYTCRMEGKEVYLFFEDDRWFMERKS